MGALRIVIAIVLLITASKAREKGEICVISTGKWAPFNHFDDRGYLVGIGIDYWRLIAKKAGIRYRLRKADRWSEVLQSLKERTCDVTIATQETPDRLRYARFSKPYASYPLAVVTKTEIGFIDSLSYIVDKSIAMPRFYATTAQLLKHYGNALHLHLVEDIDSALQSVESERDFATVGILPVVSYKIAQKYHKLKISGLLPFYFHVKIMVRKELAQALLPKIDHAIDEIGAGERNAIYHKWIYTEDSNSKIKEQLQRLRVVVAGIIVFAAFLTIYIYFLRQLIRKKTQVTQKLREMAHFDTLTGVFSRAYAEEFLTKLLRRKHKGVALMLFDLDCFKAINDRYGHLYGDEVLRHFARRLSSFVEVDDKVFRWGGDEFLIVVQEGGITKARALQHEIARDLQITLKNGIMLSFSSGIAAFRFGDTPESLFARVDEAMYRMKKSHHCKEISES